MMEEIDLDILVKRLRDRSQCAAFGAAHPRTWQEYEQSCLATYSGGHHSDGMINAYRHGMSTIFNLLIAEFPHPHEITALIAEILRLRSVEADLRGSRDHLLGIVKEIGGLVKPADGQRTADAVKSLVQAATEATRE